MWITTENKLFKTLCIVIFISYIIKHEQKQLYVVTGINATNSVNKTIFAFNLIVKYD